VKPLACTPADGNPTTTSPASTAEPSSGSSTTPTHVPREVELALPVDARQLGGLPADQRHAGGAANFGGALDELRNLLELDVRRGNVVEQDQRLGAARDHVVDAVRGEIGAASSERPAPAGEDQLGADAVGRRGEEAAVAERVQRREGAEVRGSRRLHRRAQPFDDRLCRGERDAGRVVRPSFLAHGPSLRRRHGVLSGHGRNLVPDLSHADKERSARSDATMAIPGSGVSSLTDMSGTWYRTCPR